MTVCTRTVSSGMEWEKCFQFDRNIVVYRRSGNFRVIKFSCFKFSRKNIFVVQDTHENFLTVYVLRFSDLEQNYAR